MLIRQRTGILGRLAADVDRAVHRRITRGERGRAAATLLASGDGWSVHDIVCSSGPDDRSFEERHNDVSISMVVAGTFQYRSDGVSELLTPGSLLLGNDGQCFECGHRHGSGDRCVSFHFAPEFFERIHFDVTGTVAKRAFNVARLPALRNLSRVNVRVAVGLLTRDAAWDELAVELAATTLRLANDTHARPRPVPPNAEARIAASVASIERDPSSDHSLPTLARDAGLSVFHYLRTFRRVTGVTPHQFILRTRLREAAARLALADGAVGHVGLDSGFDDLSNFNHTFRSEFGMTPRRFRRQLATETFSTRAL